jgi:hypothetical protein
MTNVGQRRVGYAFGSLAVLALTPLAAEAQSIGSAYVLPFSPSAPALSALTYTQLLGYQLTNSAYTLPVAGTDSVAIGSVFAPDHRGYVSGAFSGIVNGACPSIGAADPRCAVGAATPPEASALGSIAIGQSARVVTTGASDPGRDIGAGEFGIAIGSSALVSGYHGVSIGLLSKATGVAAVGVGPEARSSGLQSVAMGDISTASADRSVAIGGLSTASAEYSTALGALTTASGVASMALGVESEASGLQSVAIGVGTQSSGTGSLAIGDNTKASGDASTAVGYVATASGLRSIALGPDATAGGTSSIAVGDESSATGSGASAFGAGAQAHGDFSTAIGPLAVATKPGEMVIGGPQTSSISLGVAGSSIKVPALASSGSYAGRSAQSGTTEFVTIDESGSLGTTPNLSGYVKDTVKSMSGGLQSAVNSTSALVAAMSAVPTVTIADDEPARCGVGTGGVGSNFAFSAGCAVRVTKRLHVNGAISLASKVDYFGTSSSGVAGRIGFSFPLFVQAPSRKQVSGNSQSQLPANQLEKIEQLSKENEQIKAELASLRQLLVAATVKYGKPLKVAAINE